MKKIENPFINREEYNCFGCSPKNDCGLKMTFHEEDDKVVSFWEPDKKFAGYKNILHGGIHSTLMDETASWFVFTKMETAGVTYGLEVRYKKPVRVDKGKLKLVASKEGIKRNIVTIRVDLFSSEGILSSSGKIKYFLFDRGKAKSELNYPGLREFFTE